MKHQKHTSHKKRLKILLVEDDRGAQERIAKTLNTQGYDVLAAANGAEGLKGLHQQPDAVVIDLFLPNMNSFSFMGFKESNPAFRDIPVYFISEHAARADGLKRALGDSAQEVFLGEHQPDVVAKQIATSLAHLHKK